MHVDLSVRRSGVLLHPSSLPGPHGIGDLGPEAFAFVDWLKASGQRVWQWLPTTPIGPGDSPYQSVSAFAGSPLMVALQPLVAKGWLAEPQPPPLGFDSRRVNFGLATSWRMSQLREAFAGFSARAGTADRTALARWQATQAHWLDDYALFMALEQAHDGHAWWQWHAALARRDTQALAAARQSHAQVIDFWVWLQWCFDEQCGALKRYANERGILLVGDLPIYTAHHSADCWARPDLYQLDEQFQPTVVAGVPPDDLGPDGQRWGNPLYRWPRMAAENHRWWTARVRRALGHADVFRIDHFRGFAGYWEIPASEPKATVGRWVPGPGKPLFDAIAAEVSPRDQLPIIAEDLGLITPDVTALRDACGLPGMKILQFAFSGDGHHEYLPHNWTARCVAYSGTHDNNTARGWWDAATPGERHLAGTYLACGAHDVHWAMIRAACNSVASLAVFPLQDVLGLPSAARMNTPGTVGGNNWTWRFEWSDITPHTTRVLGMLAAASGRAEAALLHA